MPPSSSFLFLFDSVFCFDYWVVERLVEGEPGSLKGGLKTGFWWLGVLEDDDEDDGVELKNEDQEVRARVKKMVLFEG